MDPLELEQVANRAVEAARSAAKILMQGYRSDLRVEYKGRADLVTRFDRDSEALLRERLQPTGIAFVGEETGGAPSEYTFYVDPLDGTTNFAHGHPFFAVSIALLRGAEPLFGVVLAPALGIEWVGLPGLGKGATRNGALCRVSPIAALEQAMLATGFPGVRTPQDFEAFTLVKPRCQAVRRCGSAAIDLCLVADGTYEAYFERRLNPWDLGAGAAMVLGAGGRLSDLMGGPCDVRTGQVLASNGLVHQEVEALLRTTDYARQA